MTTILVSFCIYVIVLFPFSLIITKLVFIGNVKNLNLDAQISDGIERLEKSVENRLHSASLLFCHCPHRLRDRNLSRLPGLRTMVIRVSTQPNSAMTSRTSLLGTSSSFGSPSLSTVWSPAGLWLPEPKRLMKFKNNYNSKPPYPQKIL